MTDTHNTRLDHTFRITRWLEALAKDEDRLAYETGVRTEHGLMRNPVHHLRAIYYRRIAKMIHEEFAR